MRVSKGRLDNDLLNSLRPDDLNLLKPYLTLWKGRRGEALHEPGKEIEFAYFPCGPSVVSALVVLNEREAIETVLVGKEGVAGGIVSDGQPRSHFRYQIQSPGEFLRIELSKLEQAKSKSVWLSRMFARYAQYLLASLYQSIACNGAHSIQQRTAKWLIAAMDRAGAPQVPLTQEQLSTTLGVGRSYVSGVIQALKANALLRTGRGNLIIDDVDGLRNLACGCHVNVRRFYDELLGGIYSAE